MWKAIYGYVHRHVFGREHLRHATRVHRGMAHGNTSGFMTQKLRNEPSRQSTERCGDRLRPTLWGPPSVSRSAGGQERKKNSHGFLHGHARVDNGVYTHVHTHATRMAPAPARVFAQLAGDILVFGAMSIHISVHMSMHMPARTSVHMSIHIVVQMPMHMSIRTSSHSC